MQMAIGSHGKLHTWSACYKETGPCTDKVPKAAGFLVLDYGILDSLKFAPDVGVIGW